MGANRLLIHWKDQSVQYYTEDSPIRQAMVAAAEAGSKPPAAYTATTGNKGESKKKAAAYRPATADGVAGLLAQGSARRTPTNSTTVTFI
jgi:hypothetical protein